ncbi:MAG TPA: hypothetical protein VH702_15740 [Vicinamibacterales bacterium]|jgi:hypothetical protein
MQRRHREIIGILICAGLPLTGCEQPIRGAAADGAAGQVVATKIERIAGSELNRLTLTARSAERLELKTAQVVERQMTRAGNAATRKVIPYSAVLYDSSNNTWVYANPQPLVFVRTAIKIDYFDGDQAVVFEGPDVGTAVVTVGAAELFATEFESGH